MGKTQREASTNSISMARKRILFDHKNGFRSSNVVFGSGIDPEDVEEYNTFSKNFIDKNIEPHKYYQEVDSSAAILKNQKIREVHYKKRKRKVDQDKERMEERQNDEIYL